MLPVKAVVNIASKSASDKVLRVHAAFHFHNPIPRIVPHQGAHSLTSMDPLGLYGVGSIRLEYTDGSLVIPLSVSS